VMGKVRNWGNHEGKGENKEGNGGRTLSCERGRKLKGTTEVAE